MAKKTMRWDLSSILELSKEMSQKAICCAGRATILPHQFSSSLALRIACRSSGRLLPYASYSTQASCRPISTIQPSAVSRIALLKSRIRYKSKNRSSRTTIHGFKKKTIKLLTYLWSRYKIAERIVYPLLKLLQNSSLQKNRFLFWINLLALSSALPLWLRFRFCELSKTTLLAKIKIDEIKFENSKGRSNRKMASEC